MSYSEADEVADTFPAACLRRIKTRDDALAVVRQSMGDQGWQVIQNTAEAVFLRASGLSEVERCLGKEVGADWPTD